MASDNNGGYRAATRSDRAASRPVAQCEFLIARPPGNTSRWRCALGRVCAIKSLPRLRKFVWLAAFFQIYLLFAAHAFAASDDARRWASHAQNTSIVRDDWGIAHIHGRT